MKALGWAHEGEEARTWDRSCLGFDEAWEKEPRKAGFEGKGKQTRARSGTETEETYIHASTPSTLDASPRPGWYQSSTPERVRSPPPPPVGFAGSTTASGTSTPPKETRLSFSGQHGGDEESNVGTPRGARARQAQEDDDDTVGSYRPEGVDYDELRRRRIEEENERELMA